MTSVLSRFSPATRRWFEESFALPTPAQEQAWESISSGRHTVVIAPTGSGKTLAAFLWALDALGTRAEPAEPSCSVVYVSPLKALAVDVQRNLTAPLVGIDRVAARDDLAWASPTVALRSGDTPAAARRAFASRPADILITTPESLYLLLTSAARESLRSVTTVIIDEIHAVAASKRGSHLAVSLERLDALLETPAQRIGLSATVAAPADVAAFLGGAEPAHVVHPPAEKRWDLTVEVPVPDLTAIAPLATTEESVAHDTSVWPHIEERLVDIIASHRSTLVFANSRRQAERLTTSVNDRWAARQDEDDAGDPPARAHHGSVSKEQRAVVEEALKAGQLRAVVATSSLELGIDMGAVDVVAQVESPPSVASGLQRVGRAGHQVGAVSRGVFFPKHRGDALLTAVVVERMAAGHVERPRPPRNPLDVLTQHLVAMAAVDTWTLADAFDLVRRAHPFRELSYTVFCEVLDMLAGKYPSEDFADLRPRIVWDRTTDTFHGRPGAQRLAVTNGGTIPDRGLFGVFIAGAEGPGRRVGELDEEMVYESRVGDVITLGTSSWRIEDLTHDQVLVSPAPGVPGKLPFWKADAYGRPAELGEALGRFVAEVSAASPTQARARCLAAGLNDWAADNVLAYLAEQQQATAQLPSHRTLVVERSRDEIGDWRVCIHSPWGSAVHAPWALVLADRLHQRLGIDVHPWHCDDGIVLRVPDVEVGAGKDWWSELLETLIIDPDEVQQLVTERIGGSSLFAARFRECAARALLLPRRNPGRRQALWQQRLRSAQLLEVARLYPTFPVVMETVRECMQDVFDVPRLTTLLRDLRSGAVQVHAVTTPTASPFTRSMIFGYVAQYLYEADAPLAERQAAALSLDPDVLQELLGGGSGTAVRDLLVADVVEHTEAGMQALAPDRQARHAEEVADLVRRLGPITTAELQRRTVEEFRDAVPQWCAELSTSRRIISVSLGARECWADVHDAGRLHCGLGVVLPPGTPHALVEEVPDPVGDFVVRYGRTHAFSTVPAIAAWLGMGTAVVRGICDRLVASGRWVAGSLDPRLCADQAADAPTQYADREVLRLLKRRSLASLRAEVEPVTHQDYATFLLDWHGVGQGRSADDVYRALEQLSGLPLPASAWETMILPARVPAYSPALLDELLAAGEVGWSLHGTLGATDAWVAWHVLSGDTLVHPPQTASDEPLTPSEEAVVAFLRSGGHHGFAALHSHTGLTTGEAKDAVWSLALRGLITNDTALPLRAFLGSGRGRHRTPTAPRVTRRPSARATLRTSIGRPTPALAVPALMAGRWWALPPADAPAAQAELVRAEGLLDRYGVVTRGCAVAEDVPGGYAQVYRVLAAAEEAGIVRRGYFVEGLGASQFAQGAVVDRLRAHRSRDGVPNPAAPPDWFAAPAPMPSAHILAATDPAQPFGAALPWPERADGETDTHRPGRRAGALVAIIDGRLAAFLERGSRSCLTWPEGSSSATSVAAALATVVQDGRIAEIAISTIDGVTAVGSEHPLAVALLAAGFHTAPQGIRLRRRP